MFSLRYRWLVLIAGLLPLCAAYGDESADSGSAASPDASRPRVGLVLGGGGARGAAHIGVLMELERLRVPVDAVVGTSMGAIVGGLYASGMSAADLQVLVSTLNWADALSDSPDRSDLGFRRKQDDEEFPMKLELGLSGRNLSLPQGAIQGQALDLLLRELTIDVSHIDDFDRLPIPFRAVASDLVTGKPYVMGSGDLAQAIRASMSVPGAIAPVAIDGHLLVDGGIVGNLGVEVMQAMDVDVIIAVDVEFPLYEFDELSSALAISEQVLTILIRNETLRQIERLDEDDVLIRPQLGTFGSSEFARSSEAIAPGIAATREKLERLEGLALSESAYATWLASRTHGKRNSDTVAFATVVDGNGRPMPRLQEQLRVEPGDAIDAEVFAREANRLFGMRAFEKVGYQLVDQDNRTGVLFTASSRSWGKSFLKFGLGIEDDFEGSTAFHFAARLWQPGVNRFGAEWRTDVRVGTSPSLESEFYQPLGLDSSFFVSPRIDLSQRNIETFDADEAIARLRVSEVLAGLDVGVALGNWGEFRTGIYRGDGNARVKVGDPGVPNQSFDIGGVFGRLQVDTFDDANFPRQGTRAEVRWDGSRPGLGAKEKYDTLTFDINRAWSRGKSTLVGGVNYATSNHAGPVVQAHFPLGGFLRLSGLERGQLRGPHAGVARLLYYRRIGSSAGGLVELPIYFGASLEAGNVWQTRDEIGIDSLVTNGSLFFGLDTFFGPMFLAAGLSETGNSNFYLFIGAIPD